MTDVILQQFGMGMADGTVVAWLKQVGDTVEKGEVIAEVEAAKATLEIEAPVSGTLTSILVQEDENVPIQTVLATIE